MKLRIRFAGRREKVDFDNDPTIATVKETVAHLLGQDVSHFELSLNGRDALEGEPDTPLSQFDIVSGDLLCIIVTNQGAVQQLGAEDRASSSNTHGTVEASRQAPSCVRMEAVDGPGNEPRNVVETAHYADEKEEQGLPSTEDPTSHPSTSGVMRPQQCESQVPMDEGEEDLPRSVREPMLCRSATDCMIPQRLRALYIENRPQTMDEALYIVLHVLMLETGFYTKPKEKFNTSSSVEREGDSSSNASAKKHHLAASSNDDDDIICSDIRVSMPSGWRAAHKLSYCHPSCEGAVSSIAMVPVGKQIVVHGLTSGRSHFHLQLKSSDYVTSLNDQNPMYTNLPELSRLYKDSIAYPLLVTTREELGLVPLNGLRALFPEIQLLILSFLDVRSLLYMSEVSQHFHNMAADRLLWRQLLLRDFGCKDSDSNLDWRQLYKQKYKNKKDLERYRRNLLERSIPIRPAMFFPPVPPYPVMPGYPPGYRGGDRDLDPFAGLAQPNPIPIRRDPTAMPFPGQPDILPFPDRPSLRDPILNPLPRIPNRRDPLGNGRNGNRTGGNNRGFYF